jgi:hypothetical protein
MAIKMKYIAPLLAAGAAASSGGAGGAPRDDSRRTGRFRSGSTVVQRKQLGDRLSVARQRPDQDGFAAGPVPSLR